MSEDHQSSYTGAQLDAAIASYVNRSTGQIILTPTQLNGSLPGGYYSGVSASLDYSSLNAESSHILTGHSAIGKNGKTDGGMQSGNVSLTLTPSNLSPSTSPNKFVPSASASLDYSSLTAEAAHVLQGMTFIGKNGVQSGSLVAANIQTGTGQSSGEKSFVISGLTGTPSNVILYAVATISGSYFSHIYSVGGVIGGISSSSYKSSGFNFAFNSSAGTCTLTITSSNVGMKMPTNKNFNWIVW